MAAVASAQLLSTRPSLAVSRKTVSVRSSRPQTVCRAAKPVVASAAEKKQQLTLPVAVAAGVATMMADPLVAEAAVTPSLRNLLGSLVAGGAVLAAIVAAVSAVSSFDPVARGRK